MAFRDLLRQQLKLKGMRPAELARRADTTPQNISRILTDKPHPLTGAPPKVGRETVIKIARALDWDVNKALESAGHAAEPQTKMQKLLDVLQAEGIDTAQALGGFSQLQHMTDEQYDELIRTVLIGIRVWHEQYSNKKQ